MLPTSRRIAQIVPIDEIDRRIPDVSSRRLIKQADDFGMCHAVNLGIAGSFQSENNRVWLARRPGELADALVKGAPRIEFIPNEVNPESEITMQATDS